MRRSRIFSTFFLALCLSPSAWGAPTQDTVEALVGLEGDRIADLFLIKPSKKTVRALLTFFDNDVRSCPKDLRVPAWARHSQVVFNAFKKPCKERIDSLREAFFLARYLYEQHNRELRKPIQQIDFERHQGEFIPADEFVTKAIDLLEAQQEGKDLRQAWEDSPPHGWTRHAEQNRQAILQSTKLLWSSPQARKTVMILGAGPCGDIPLEYLATHFQVILVDIDLPSMESAVRKLSPALREHVELEVRDLSGDIVASHAHEINDIIATSPDYPSALARLDSFFKSARVYVPVLEGNRHVDLMVSSMLMTQIPYFIYQQIREGLHRAFDTDTLGWHYKLPEGNWQLYEARFNDAHTEALVDFAVRTGALVHLATETMSAQTVLLLGDFRSRMEEALNQGATIEDLNGMTFAPDQTLYLKQSKGPRVTVQHHYAKNGRTLDLIPNMDLVKRYDPWIWDRQIPTDFVAFEMDVDLCPVAGKCKTLKAGTYVRAKGQWLWIEALVFRADGKGV